MAHFRSPRLQGALLVLVLSVAWVPSPPAAPLEVEVEYRGCQAVLVPGPVCVPGPKRKLRLWVGAPPEGQIEIWAGGVRIDAGSAPVREGRLFSVTLPAGAEALEVLVQTVDGRGTWSLALGDRRGTGRDVLREVRKQAQPIYTAIEAHRFLEARKALDGIHLPEKAPAESRCIVAYYRGLLAEREGDYRTALAKLQKAIEAAERVHIAEHQKAAEQMRALLLLKVGRSREAAEIFARLRRDPPANPYDVADLLSNQGWAALLAREAGEVAEDPTPLFEEALKTYAASQRTTPEDRGNVLINLAFAHLQEGRLAEARDLLVQARELEPHPPLTHTQWGLDLKGRIALSEGRPAAALALYDDLEQLAVAAVSPDGRLRAALGRAQSQIALGNPAAALETLRQAGILLDGQSLQIPIEEGRETFVAMRQSIVGLHLKILLDQRRNAEALEVARHARSRVLRQLERGDRLASLPPDLRDQWTDLLLNYRKRRAALEERVKDDWKVPEDQLPQEKAARMAEAEAVKRLLDEAFQLLRGAGERKEEMPPAPRPGELILAYHPLPEGWVGFVADGKTVAVRRIELPADLRTLSAEELSRRLLQPFRGEIERAKRLRILASGPLEAVDFHALPFGGDVLLAGRPVVYGLDLPVLASTKPPGRHVLLVTDPRGDLPGALAETRAVRGLLEAGSHPWNTEELKNDQASAAAVLDRLPEADLLHYAGHGTFSGLGGWDSSLRLAQGTSLTLGDFLALDRVPAWVVLSACNAGQTSTETPIQSLGLAHAFLLAGARSVVASTRLANDRQMPEFFAELYREWDREPDLAVALQRAQLSWRRRNPTADWAGFRLFEP